MSKIYGVALIVLCSLSVSAQSIYYSPYVIDGASFSVDVPKGMYPKSGDVQFVELALYISDTTVDFSVLRLKDYTAGVLLIMHTPREGKSLEDYMQQIIDSADVKMVNNAKFSTKPKIVKIKGEKFFITGFKGRIGDEDYEHFYTSATIFGDYYITITALASQKKVKINSMRRLKKILKSFNLVITDDENKLDVFDFEDIELSPDQVNPPEERH